MTFNITISAEAERRLREQASAAGKDLPTFVQETLEKLAPAPANGSKTPQQWSAESHAWASNHPTLNYIVDDSRESIYAGRGE